MELLNYDLTHAEFSELVFCKTFLDKNCHLLKCNLSSGIVRLQDSEDTQDREIGLLYDEGSFLFCSGKYEEAIKYYDMILKLKPCSKIALGYKGLALIKLKKRVEAVRCYQLALNC